MAFGDRLQRAAALVDSHLAAVLDGMAAQGAPDRLVQAMRHASLGGGKRLRPYLVLDCAALFGVAAGAAIHAAVAIECVHCYSLAHDDLPAMDDDAMRRGKPALHKAFDEWTAILAGDALLTLAFEMLAEPQTHADAGIRVALASGLARACGAAGMVGGQCLDLEADKLGMPPQPSFAHVERLQAMKTGALIRFACEAGAILGAATPAELSALSTYGGKLGQAFQIADDILDVEGEAQTVGKAVRKDSAKATLTALIGLDAAKARLADLERDALAALAPFGPDADALREAARFVVRRDR